MEQLKIEKMRQFYDIFPYPNRHFLISPKVEAQLIAHGGFSYLLAQGKKDFAQKIKNISTQFIEKTGKVTKEDVFLAKSEIEDIFPKSQRVLLVGCGTDEPLLFRKLHPLNEIIGVDLSRKAIQKARRKLAFHNIINLIFYQKRLQRVEFLLGAAEMVLNEKAIGKFDFIQCFGVLHHQPDPALILSSMSDRLNEGGVLRLMIYSFHGRRLERRIQTRYSGIWDHFLQKRRFKFQVLYNYALLRIWQFFNFMGLFSSTTERFRYLGPGSVTVADALMHPSDAGVPLTHIYELAVHYGLELVYCEGKLENEGYILGFENPLLAWNKIVEADKRQELLTNPILIFRKAKKVESE